MQVVPRGCTECHGGLLRVVAGAVPAFLVLALVTAVAPAAGAAQESMSQEEVRRLAGRAADDPAALERLRQVRTVDGRPADLAQALGDSQRTAERLRVLAEGDGAALPPGARAVAGRQAGEILDERRFKPSEPPRPFRGALRRLGGWLRPVFEPVGRFLGRLFDSPVFWAVAGVVVVVLAVILSIRAARRRARAGLVTSRRRRLESRPDPAALEREADEAERRGQLERAFRLRFRAGLLRLDDAGHLAFRDSLTTGEVVRQVPSGTLSGLAGTLENIVYAGRPARPDDLDAARSGWPRVLEEAGSR